MKIIFCIALFMILAFSSAGQKTLVVQKMGTLKKFGFNEGDYIKLKVGSTHEVFRSYIRELGDSTVTVGNYHTVKIDDIKNVYKRYSFPAKLGVNLFFAGGAFLLISVINNLIMHDPAFNEGNLIITGSLFAAGGISIALSQKTMRIGLHWKVRILPIAHL